jgi:hypothetical protein
VIKPDATLSIQRISLSKILVTEFQERYTAQLLHYIQLLTDHPGEYAGLLHVTPSDTHPGLFVLLEGHHRYVASIMCGRPDVLAVVVEEPSEESRV